MTEQLIQNIANIAQSLAIIVMIVIFIITFRHQVRASHAQIFTQLCKTYDEIARLRANNPSVLALVSRWKPENLEQIYSGSFGFEQWAMYYSYGELCVGFCNTCVYFHSEGHISDKIYKDFFQGLVNLLITENTSLFKQVADLPYCSKSFRLLLGAWKPT